MKVITFAAKFRLRQDPGRRQLRPAEDAPAVRRLVSLGARPNEYYAIGVTLVGLEPLAAPGPPVTSA
jgi:hypothetical protein